MTNDKVILCPKCLGTAVWNGYTCSLCKNSCFITPVKATIWGRKQGKYDPGTKDFHQFLQSGGDPR